MKQIAAAVLWALVSIGAHAQTIERNSIDELTTCGHKPTEGISCGVQPLLEIVAVGTLTDGIFEAGAASFFVGGFDGRSAELKLESVHADFAVPTTAPGLIGIYGFNARDGGLMASDAVAGGVLLTSFLAPNDAGVYRFDVTSFVSGATQLGWTNVGFALRTLTFDSAVRFVGPNTLALTVAEPATYSFLLLGLGALALLRRVKRTVR